MSDLTIDMSFTICMNKPIFTATLVATYFTLTIIDSIPSNQFAIFIIFWQVGTTSFSVTFIKVTEIRVVIKYKKLGNEPIIIIFALFVFIIALTFIIQIISTFFLFATLEKWFNVTFEGSFFILNYSISSSNFQNTVHLISNRRSVMINDERALFLIAQTMI